MRRRSAVTLMEVLIAMFIMAIGMLALLALFPVGAVSMAQALKDDRCASTAALAENLAIAKDVRHDPLLTLPTGVGFGTKTMIVYVDPYYAITVPGPPPLLPPLGWPVGGVIPRAYPSFALTTQLADRFFSLPDDITFLENGTPQTDGAFIDRGRRYSYAYLLRMQALNLVQLYVVVYQGRPVNSLLPEPAYVAAGTAGTNNIVVSTTGANLWPPIPPFPLNPWPPTIKRGGWILDHVNGYFYRVSNLENTSATTMTVETQQNLIANVSQITVMDYAAEVFDKGTSWQP